MSGERSDGGPAFPQNDLSGYGIGPNMDGDRYMVAGMSLRDWFAGQAMGALIVANEGHPSALGLGAAKDAYAVADKMLAVREDGYRTASTEQGR